MKLLEIYREVEAARKKLVEEVALLRKEIRRLKREAAVSRISCYVMMLMYMYLQVWVEKTMHEAGKALSTFNGS